MPVDEINEVIAKRNIPSQPLQPYFSMVPMSTKFQIFPSYDRRIRLGKPQATYSVEDVFNPGTAVAPWSGYAKHVNTEMRLQNRYFALQRADQALYVPTSKSELYRYNVRGGAATQPHPGLFKPFEEISSRLPSTNDATLFINSTRQHLRDIPTKN
jgi:hypothetical protein